MPIPDVPASAQPEPAQPQRVSDRGQLEGPPASGQPPLRQSHPEVQAAAEAGFQAIALDVYMTGEHDLVTIGSPDLFELREDITVHVEDVSRAQLETLQRPAPTVPDLLRMHPDMQFLFVLHPPTRPELRGVWVESVVRTFAGVPRERVSLSMDDPVLAGVLAGYLHDSGVPVGLTRAPETNGAALAWLQTARALGLSWLYLPHHVVDAALLETAHRWGVRVGLNGVTGAAAVLRLMTGQATPDAYMATRAFLLTASAPPPAPAPSPAPAPAPSPAPALAP